MTSRGGRPMLQDVVRYACGKINKAETERQIQSTKRANGEADVAPPSPKVKAARDFFSARCFKGGGQGAHAGDAIGQLWLLGKLEMPDLDDTKLLQAARDWWYGRSVTFKDLGAKVGSPERASRTSNASTKLSKAEKTYEHYERFLRDASDFEAGCLHDLMEIDLDGNIAWWASRIIQTEILRYVRLPLVELASDRDYHMLEAAKRALMAMAGAEAMKRSAA